MPTGDRPTEPVTDEAPIEVPDLKRARIASLDWARGWMLIASVTVNSLLIVPAWFDHAPWDGVHPIDTIFPIFVTLSGCGLAFAMARTVKVRPLLRRVVVLLLLGLVYNAITEWSLDVFTWRITGVLQLYAVLVAVIGLLHLVTRSWRGWAAITALVALAHTALLTVYATICPASVLTRECNPSGPIDSALFGAAHIYAEGAAGHDPEGIVTIFGALISASAGATIGHLLLATRRRGLALGRGPEAAIVPVVSAAAGFLVFAGLMMVTLPIALGVELPVMKRLWTAPFALTIAAGSALALLVGHLLLDRAKVPRFIEVSSYPLLALGRNSLLVYFGSHALMSVLKRPVGSGPSIADRISGALALVGPPQLLWTALLLIFWIGLATLLHRHRIYLRP
ncbi:heparan-alpha-glucosaminide N-acetyltransferase domain-containing protein [Agromyces italicus]|uniref:heparan-alpha-glucosaminide N-acetyltransferase domain-containing protein n=1 Tax=Agromyces italicus TaxID=279572 RepID=UPI00146BC258|nr:heparan-alpha-glucosaminide N-acetyltransferase domain-containing protein [Agromyces italicus]